MRVLLSASTFPLQPGDGLPRFVLELAQALSTHCEVTALVPAAPGAARSERWGSVAVERFAYFWPGGAQRLAYGDGMDANLRRSWLARLQLPAFLAAQLAATRALLRRGAFDVVNSHWLVPQGLSSALVRGGSLPRFRHVLTLHGGDVHLLAARPGGRRLARFVLDRTDAVFAASTALRDRLDGLLGEPSGALVQPVGVRAARFGAAAAPGPGELRFDGGYLLYVGRLHRIKGVEDLLQALPAVRERHPLLGLLVVGDGERAEALREQARALGLGSAVQFAGRCGPDAVARYLSGCEAAVVPSVREPDGRTEGMPAVVLEALAAGARVVATATGGIPDVIRHGENGWLCRDRDPAHLAATVLEALATPQEEVSGRARACAARFDWRVVAERYRQAFAGTLS